MANDTFGVTFSTVAANWFPHQANFSKSSTPTSDAVTTYIQRAAAKLFGLLAQKNISADTIQNNQTTYPNAYIWCAEYIEQQAAIRAAGNMKGDQDKLIEKWETEILLKEEELDRRGYLAVGGDAPAPGAGQEATDMRYFVDDLGLDDGTSDTTAISSAAPVLRKDDSL